MPKEKPLTNLILDEYRKRGAFAEKIHGGPTQPRLVDVIACYKGYFIALEVKIGHNYVPTPYQLHIIEDVVNAGGLGSVVYSLNEAVGHLDAIDRYLKAYV